MEVSDWHLAVATTVLHEIKPQVLGYADCKPFTCRATVNHSVQGRIVLS
jgi:hypothetical protein